MSEVEAICERVIIISSGRVGLNKRLDEIESESRILMEARGPADAILQTLQKIDGVADAKLAAADDGVANFEIATRDEKDVREELSQAITAQGWTIRRLERKARKLEDAFFDVQRAQDPLKAPLPPLEPAPPPQAEAEPAAATDDAITQ